MAKIVYVVAQNYRDAEYHVAAANLGAVEHDVASFSTGTVQGADGKSAEATLTVDDIDVNAYDGIAIAGGPGIGAVLYKDPEKSAKLVSKVKEFNSAGKLVAAICLAPIALAKAGIISGKNVTVWDDGKGTQKGEMEAAGANCTMAPLEKAGDIITADGPSSAAAFGKAIAEYFGL
jgi:protease I